MTTYLIAHIGHTTKSHHHITWWKPERCGYTVCIEKAGRYSESEAKTICDNSICIAVPFDVAESISKPTPYYRRSSGDLNRMYDGGEHVVVRNQNDEWSKLLDNRLSNGVKPIKPTPIGFKADDVYLPTKEVAA